MKNLLTVTQLGKTEIQEILDLSVALDKNPEPTLKNKNIVFVFEKPSLRTKVGTEVAINHLGGNVIHVPVENFFEGKVLFSEKGGHDMAGRESLKDTVKNVSQWCDGIFSRVFSHQTLLDISEYSSIPVVNALCDLHHPMQAFADLLTIKENFGDEKVTVSFVGDANNVAFSLLEIVLKFGYNARFAGPEEYSFSANQQDHLQNLAEQGGGDVLFTNNPQEAVKGVDVVYTDTFVSMGEESVFDEKMKAFKKYQVNKELFSLAKENAIFMHCLPAHRNVEVTDEIIDSKNSVVYQQAKNRMVVSKGVFTKLLSSK